MFVTTPGNTKPTAAPTISVTVAADDDDGDARPNLNQVNWSGLEF